MRNVLSISAGMIAVALVQFAVGEPLSPEWRYFSPILNPQTRKLGREEADRILAKVCETPVRVEGVDLTCTTRRLGPNFSSIVDRTFHPKVVIFGHFLAPENDDIAVSG
jgi:hypothetical protein